MRRLLSATGAVSLVITGLVFIMLAMGSVFAGQPSALRDFEACDLPCWNGIVLQHTSWREADALLRDSGYNMTRPSTIALLTAYRPDTDEMRCTARMNGLRPRRIQQLALYECQDVRIGDVMALLGEPDGILSSGLGVSFRNGTVIVTVDISDCDLWLRPQIKVVTIHLQPTLTMYPEQVTLLPWRGFLTERRYLEHEPNLLGCV